MTPRVTNRWPDDDVILYDGVCVFCSRWVRFVAARDTARRFRFTAIQSGYGTRLAQVFGIDPNDPDTNAVVHGGEVFLPKFSISKVTLSWIKFPNKTLNYLEARCPRLKYWRRLNK
jgi:predicted DCC family thiol-disulfide oxidoreductase YuxK